MVPNSLSIIDLAEMAWDKIAIEPTALCVRSPLKNSSGFVFGESIVAWRLGESSLKNVKELSKSARVTSSASELVSAESVEEPSVAATPLWCGLSPASSEAWSCWRLKRSRETLFVAIVPSEFFIDRLVNEFGPPPALILRDWLRQATTRSASLLLEKPMNGIAISPDGLLRFVPDHFGAPHSIENVADLTRPIYFQISDSQLLVQLNKYATMLDCLASKQLLASKPQVIEFETHSLAEFLKSQGMDCSIARSGIVSGGVASLLSQTNGPSKPLQGFATPRAQKPTPPSRSRDKQVSRNRWAIPASIGLIVVFLGIGYAVWPGKSPDVQDSIAMQVSRSPSHDDVDSTLPIISQDENDPSLAMETTSPSMEDLILTETAGVGDAVLARALEIDAAQELQTKLMQEMGSDGTGPFDSSKLASIASLLSPQPAGTEPLMESESLKGSEIELKTLEDSFADSPEDNSQTVDQESKMIPLEDSEGGDVVGGDLIGGDVNAAVEKSVAVALKRPVQKEEFRVPFTVNAKQSSVRVEWSFPDEVLITPEVPVVIKAKQEQTWMIALKDESCKLAVTIKSKPGRKWLLGFVVKLRRADGAEIPIAPGDAKSIQQPLIARSKELTQQTEFLEMLKSSSKGRAFSNYYLPRAIASLKENESAIDQWMEVDALVNEFYSTHKLALTFLEDSSDP